MIDKYLLFPYYGILKLRDILYRKGVKKVQEADVPTICIGNITAGGTGKTPHTEMILKELLESDEWGNMNLAVLSRGYKRESSGFQQVDANGSAAMFGDEPLQVKKKFPGITVAVDKNRVEGCRFLSHPDLLNTKSAAKKCWNKDLPAADLILLDDAFQYRRLKAFVNIVLVDFNRPIHKDHLLPLGRLRDLPERIGDADIIIVTKCPCELDGWQKTIWAETLGIRDYSTITCEGTSAAGRKQFIFFSHIVYGLPTPIYDSSDSRYTYSKRMILFTGIAKDKPLRNFLGDKYRIVRRFCFPDHHRFVWNDFQRIQRAANHWPTAAIVTTEKDAQRVLDYKGLPLSLRERMLMIPIHVEFLSEEEHSIFRSTLLGKLRLWS